MRSWPEELLMWVVYDHPKDHPDNYVARRWLGEQATEDIIIGPDLELIRSALQMKGLYRLDRWPGDEPMIVEVWL